MRRMSLLQVVTLLTNVTRNSLLQMLHLVILHSFHSIKLSLILVMISRFLMI